MPFLRLVTPRYPRPVYGVGNSRLYPMSPASPIEDQSLQWGDAHVAAHHGGWELRTILAPSVVYQVVHRATRLWPSLLLWPIRPCVLGKRVADRGAICLSFGTAAGVAR